MNRFVEVDIDSRETCAGCGASIDATAAFCSHCGTKHIIKQQTSTACIRCGQVLTSAVCENCALEYRDAPDGTILLKQRICADCGAKLTKEQDFCSKCGKNGAEAKQEERKLSAVCPRCGDFLSAGKPYCMTCGAKWKNLVRPILQADHLQCPACGQGGMKANRTVCFTCGAEFVESQWRCSHCGKENEYANPICFYCGQQTGPKPQTQEPKVAKKNWIKTDCSALGATSDKIVGLQTVSADNNALRSENTDNSSSSNSTGVILSVISLAFWLLAPFAAVNWLTFGNQPTALEILTDDVTLIGDIAATPAFWAAVISLIGIIGCFVSSQRNAYTGVIGFAITAELLLGATLIMYSDYISDIEKLFDVFGVGFWAMIIHFLIMIIAFNKSSN